MDWSIIKYPSNEIRVFHCSKKLNDHVLYILDTASRNNKIYGWFYTIGEIEIQMNTFQSYSDIFSQEFYCRHCKKTMPDTTKFQIELLMD